MKKSCVIEKLLLFFVERWEELRALQEGGETMEGAGHRILPSLEPHG